MESDLNSNTIKVVYIYKYTNLINAKIYIGSTVNMRLRHKQHNTRYNKGKSKFYNSIDKWGWEAFSEMELLEICSQINRNDRENYWIKYYGTLNNKLGYNLRLADNTEVSIETLEKMSKKLKGRKHTEESKRKISIGHLGIKRIGQGVGDKNPFYGKMHTEESKLKNSISHLGKATWTGKKHTEESKQKMRLAKVNKKVGAEIKKPNFILKDGFKF